VSVCSGRPPPWPLTLGGPSLRGKGGPLDFRVPAPRVPLLLEQGGSRGSPPCATTIASKSTAHPAARAGLGFARRDNLLTPRANPLTGPNGRCQDLVRAGLFSNAAACRQFFNQAK